MKVLSIGNSFSTDAHTYLPHLAKAAGKELLLCNLYSPGATIEEHYRNYEDENEVYVYETYLPGETEKISPDGIALHEAVEDDDWDIITLQQCSKLSGIKESYSPYLAEVAGYCRLMHPNAELMFHQTWAYEKGCLVPEFRENYGASQDEMWKSIFETTYEVIKEAEIEKVIPCGKAWQIARSTSIGDRLTRDGFHGNELGQFLSSCVFYQAIFGENAASSPFNLPEYDVVISNLLKACADAAF